MFLLLPLVVGVGMTTPEPDPVHIFGGAEVETCGWQSVVVLRGNGYLCSGNLIHPEIITTAAHCIEVMDPETEVEFGDTANTAQELAAVDYCMMNPDFVSNGDGTIPLSEVQQDYAFCKLAEPVTNVVPVPPIFGCEIDQVEVGAEIVRVGFGRGSVNNSQFFKREVQIPIQEIPYTDSNGWPSHIREGGGGQGTCPGDSGGPSFIRIPSQGGGPDTWRQLSIQSTSQYEDENGDPVECGTYPNNSAALPQAVAWIEEESGIDIAPCYDAFGNWDPTFECQMYPEDPADGEGNWAGGGSCETGPLSGFVDSCGGSFDDLNPDGDAPAITIVDPPEDLYVEWEGSSVAVHILAEADDGDGWGMSNVTLVIYDYDTGDELGSFDDPEEAYEWEPDFPMGLFEIVAVGTDNAGHAAESNRVLIGIGVDPPAGETTGGTGGGDTTGGEGDGGGDEGGGTTTGNDDGGDDGAGETGDPSGGGESGTPPQRGGDEGCGCRTGGSGGWALLGLLGLLGWRRRSSPLR